ncbi:MAG TPA: nuclear transport factor 2 family protein [Kofleriaceae bacterium]|jgi:ketosteroid isomerase-like protein
MANPQATRSVVETYFTAWSTRDVERAYACLAPDLEFVGPSARCATAEQFRPGLVAFAKLTKSARIAELFVDGDRAAMLYDCEFVTGGTTRIASFFRVEADKIRWYETVFDATEFRKAVASAL